MRTLIINILLFLFCGFALEVSSSEQPSFYRRWMDLPTERLMEMGRQYERRSMADSAIVCYTIVANRYDKQLPAEDKRRCADAYINMWSVYFLAYLDYPKSYECLSKAQDICQELHIEIPRIDLDQGGMYGTIADICHDSVMDRRAMEAFRKAFWATHRNAEHENMSVAFANLVDRAYRTHSLDSIAREWKEYSRVKFDKDQEYVTYNKLMYTALALTEKKRYAEALRQFEQQLAVMPRDSRHLRYVCQTYFNMGMVHAKQHNYPDAIAALNEVKLLTDSFQMRDIKIELMNTLSLYYAAHGDHQQALEARHSYLQLKDSLLNYQQLKNMSNLEFLTELKKVDSQIQEAKRRKQKQDLIILSVAAMALVALAFLFVVYRKNRALTRRNESLYQKNVELLEMETEHRQLKRHLQEMHDEEAVRQTVAQDESPSAGIVQVSVDNASAAPDTPSKYKGSTMTEETKANLLALITDVMENNDEIFSPDFNVERLATLVGSRSKMVSQVINEKNDFNFNTLLNNFRIKEALRRMNDTEHYGRYSVEGISNDVGFRSRTSFTTSFKRVTGLTPTEYMRIQNAQKQQKVGQ